MAIPSLLMRQPRLLLERRTFFFWAAPVTLETPLIRAAPASVRCGFCDGLGLRRRACAGASSRAVVSCGVHERLVVEGARIRAAMALESDAMERLLADSMERIAAAGPPLTSAAEGLVMLRSLLAPVFGMGTVQAACCNTWTRH